MRFTSEFNDPNKILFFDYNAIFDMDGCVRKWHQPVKKGVVIKPELEYEGGMTLPIAYYPSPDGKKIVCHYSCFNTPDVYPELAKHNALHLSCVAESTDGVNWSRPDLGLVEYRGSRKNNIVPHPDLEFKIVMDPYDKDPNRRYKGVALLWPKKGRFIEQERGKRCFCIAFSPDGLHWSDPKPLPQFLETGDTSGLSYDERRKLFLFTTRKRGYWLSEEYPSFYSRPVKKGMPDGRWVALTTSPDFENWSPLDNILVRDEKDEDGVDFYCACPFPYGNLYLGLLRRHHFWHGLMDTELVWSQDCLRWNRSYYRQPFLGWGDLGDPDWCFGDIINCKPIRCGDSIHFYYEGRNHVHGPHNVRNTPYAGAMDAVMGLSTLRVDGFCSVESGSFGGHLVTEPLPAAGKTLLMNARTAGSGFMRIELTDRDFKPLADQPLEFRGDSVEDPLRFGASARLPSTADGTVRLKIYMENAALFSLRRIANS
jgi:hypothetical protein